MKTILCFLLLVSTASAQFAVAKAPDPNKRFLPLYLAQKSYTEFKKVDEPEQPVRHLIELAATKWNFDGVELSMDALVQEGGDDPDKYKTFVEGLASDIQFLKLENFKLRLSADFEIYSWLDESAKAILIKATLDNLPIESWSLCTSDNPTVEGITKRAVGYAREIGKSDKRMIELPGGVNIREVTKTVIGTYTVPIILRADKLAWKADAKIYDAQPVSNTFFLHYKDPSFWFRDKSVYRIQDAFIDVHRVLKSENVVRYLQGIRVKYSTGKEAVIKVQQYEDALYRDLLISYVYENGYRPFIILESSTTLKYDLTMSDKLVHKMGKKVGDKVATTIESKVGKAKMGDRGMEWAYKSIDGILTTLVEYDKRQSGPIFGFAPGEAKPAELQKLQDDIKNREKKERTWLKKRSSN